jgi:lipoprotein NlpI
LDGAIEDFTKAIQLKPGYAAAYYNRGTLEQLKGEVGCAIMDYTKAIELEPDLAVAYSNRGTAKQSKGDFDGATADFTKAIELKPDYADAYCNRGFANQAKGDFDAATADYTKAIEFKPNLMDAYNGRACLRYDSHHFTDALADFRKVVKLDSSNDYARFRVWLIRARQGHAEAATTELQTYLAGRTSGKPDDWASKIGHFLAGQMAEPEFLAAATNADKNTEAGQLCEAYFYAGSKQLFNGGKAAASTYFQKSIATGKNDFLEYFSAVEELKFLKAQN